MPPRKSPKKSPRKSRRVVRKSVRKSPRKSRRVVRKSVRKSPRKSLSCKELLQKKIRINMREYKNGRFVSPKQAVAVSYSQVRKMRPTCMTVLRRRK